MARRRIWGAPPVAIALALALGALPAVAVDPAAPTALTLPAASDDGVAASTILVDTLPPLTSIDPWATEDAAYSVAVSLPAERWELDALVESLDYDPLRAFAFVRDRIAYEPYPGVLRGAAGTLAAGAGNALDRAVLLRALLDRMLVPARFALGHLDPATAGTLVDRSIAGPADPVASAGAASFGSLDPGRVAARTARDDALLRQALGGRMATLTRSDREAAGEDATDHAWVQAFLGTRWVDLDPTLPDAAPGTTLATPDKLTDRLDPAVLQGVRLRVIAHTVDGTAPGAIVALDRWLPATTVAAGEVWLWFEPEAAGLGGDIAAALLQGDALVPVLVVDGDPARGNAFPLEPHERVLGAAATTLALTTLDLELTRTAPGRPDETITRRLLERPTADPDAGGDPGTLPPIPADAGGPLALQRVWHVMASTGGSNPRRHAVARALTADLVGQQLTQDPPPALSFSDLVWPLAVADETLALASEDAVIPALQDPARVRAYIARPRLFLASTGRDRAAPEWRSSVTDLALDDVRILAAADVAPWELVRRGIWYGAAEGAVETELLLARSRGWGATTAPAIESASLAMGPPLRVLDAQDAGTVPATTPAALREALAAGALVVTVGSPESAHTWWTVAPDGLARAILDPGLGGSLSRGAPRAGRVGDPRIEGGRTTPGSSGTRIDHGDGTYSYTNGDGTRYGPDGRRLDAERPAGDPKDCRDARQEYVFIVGCVSSPIATFIRIGVSGIVLEILIDVILTFQGP